MLVKMVFNTRAELELGKSRRNAHRGEMSKRAAFTRLIGAARIVVDFRVSSSTRVGAPPRPSVAEQAKFTVGYYFSPLSVTRVVGGRKMIEMRMQSRAYLRGLSSTDYSCVGECARRRSVFHTGASAV